MSAVTPLSSLVVVALDAAEPSDYTIELASRLVPARTPELLGLFVESARLLEHAGSRWAREFLLTGTERALDRTVLERQLRAEAEAARARFAAATARLGLRHRFEIARGDVFAEPIRRAAAAGALVLSLARAWEGGSAGSFLRQIAAAELPLVLLARAGSRSGEGVVVVIKDPAQAGTMLEAAARLAGSNMSITALVAAPAGADRAAIEARVAASLRAQGIDRGTVIRVPGYAAGIVRVVIACRPRLLVSPSPSTPAESELTEALLRGMPSALMLVRP